MDVIDSYWEEKNLGLRSFEIALSRQDTIIEFKQVENELINQKLAQYLVLKVPINAPDFLFGLPPLGYLFLETSFKLSLKKANYKCPRYIERFDKNLEVKIVHDHMGRERVYQEILKGIFNTDRIAIDPHFSQETASKRYVNWIDSLAQKGEPIYEVYLQNAAIGFFILQRIDKDNVRGILTGLYEDFQNSGYGILIMKKLNETVWENGYKTYSAHVASNNLKALRANLVFGSEIDDITYNYAKKVQH